MIIRNMIKTPDGTILESTHRHDYKTYVDKNGNTYGVDGGRAYTRRIYDVDDYEELTVTSEDSHDKIREYFIWTTAKEERLLLKNMTIEHIKAIIKTQPIDDVVKNIFETELQIRK